MANSIWFRCPNCGKWHEVEKKGCLGRFIRSIKTGDKELGETFGKAGDNLGRKALAKTVGRLVNSIDMSKHGGELLNGDYYYFRCDCGYEWGTDDDREGMSHEHTLYEKTVEMVEQF